MAPMQQVTAAVVKRQRVSVLSDVDNSVLNVDLRPRQDEL